MSSSAALLTPSGQHAIITPQADGSDRPLVRAASILAALFSIALTAYLAVIAAHDVPFLIRARLATLTTALLLLTGAVLVALVALRVQRRQRADELVALRKHLDRQVAELVRRQDGITEQLDRIEAALPDALEAHKSSDENDYDDRYLAGYADGLAGRTLGEGNVVPISNNGRAPASDKDAR